MVPEGVLEDGSRHAHILRPGGDASSSALRAAAHMLEPVPRAIAGRYETNDRVLLRDIEDAEVLLRLDA